jgi:hypothetical protein
VYKKSGNAEGLKRENRIITMVNEWRELQKKSEETPAGN